MFLSESSSLCCQGALLLCEDTVSLKNFLHIQMLWWYFF